MINLSGIIAVGVGSCFGGITRYLISKVITEHYPSIMPWGTFVVNVFGCFIIGLIYGFIERGFQPSESMKLFLTVGFCGGFTTFSTFMNENYIMIGNGSLFMSLVYTLVSISAGLVAVYLGFRTVIL